MLERYSKLFKIIHLLGDLLLLNIAFLIAFKLKEKEIGSYSDKYVVLLIVFNIIWILSASFLNIYGIFRVIKLEKVTRDLFKAIGLHLLLIAGIIVLLKGHYYSREFLFYFYLFVCLLIVAFRMLFLLYIRQAQAKGVNIRNVVIVGAGPVGMEIMKLLKSHPEYGFNILGFFDDHSATNSNKDLILGNIDTLKQYARNHKVDEIFYALPLSSTNKIQDLMKYADNNLIRFKIVPDFRGVYNRKVHLDFYNEIPVIILRSEPLENVFNNVLKRIFDIVFSFFVIILILSWLTTFLAIIIKLTSKGPVFFRQKRSGKVNEEFWCLKFRTMHVNTEADEKQATKGDKRITPIGNFLRKTSIDELPQFFNVLIGNMSVVGPRPHMLKHTKEYSAIIDKFMVRHFIKPGITGLAQIKGYRGEINNPSMLEKRIKTDIWYVENWSFLLDIKIIFLTIINVFKGETNAF